MCFPWRSNWLDIFWRNSIVRGSNIVWPRKMWEKRNIHIRKIFISQKKKWSHSSAGLNSKVLFYLCFLLLATFDMTDTFPKMGTLHSAGTTHRKAIVAVCSLPTYPRTNGLSRLLPEKKKKSSSNAVYHTTRQPFACPLPVFDNHWKWLTTPNSACVSVRCTIQMECCLSGKYKIEEKS
jgi:hypothetical protein